jgi:transposase-like protein
VAGRPLKLTPEVQQKIVAYIRQGAFPWVAAQAAGIGKSTYHRWMLEGAKAKRGLFHDFWAAVEQARAEARVTAEEK